MRNSETPNSKKLTLSKETLRTLNDDQLTDVSGGATGICVNTVVCQSGICNSGVACQSVACHSGVIC
jgi:hypothetical protein